MVVIRGGVGTVTLLAGLLLVLAAQSGMAMDSRDSEVQQRVDDGVVGDSVSARGLDMGMNQGMDLRMDLGAASDRPADPLAHWLLSAGADLDEADEQESLEASVDEAGDEVSAVVEDSPQKVEGSLSRARDRLGQEQGQEESEDGSSGDGSSGDGDSSHEGDGTGSGGHGGGSSVQEEVCGFLIAVCEAPSPAQLMPGLPAAPTLPGLPEPAGPGVPAVVEGPMPEEEDSSSWQPRQVALEGAEDAGGLRVALAAAAATALVAAVAATTATGSAGSVAAWLLRVVAGVKGFFLSLYARLKSDKVLDHGTRKELFLFIQANPGSCITQIQRVLGTSLSTTRHHLDTLRSHGLVVDVRSGRKRCFFTREGGLSPKARTATAALTSKAARRVYRQIEQNPGIGQQDLATALGVSRTSVIFHVRRLQEAGVVRQGQEGRQVVYHPVDATPPAAGPTSVTGPALGIRA